MGWPLPTGKKKLLLVVAATLILQFSTATDGNSSLARNGCLDKCGNVSIPYPFGIGKADCFLEGFEVYCPPDNVPILNTSGTPLLGINLTSGEARIQNYISRACNITEMDLADGGESSVGRSFIVSRTKNTFTAVGCYTTAFLLGDIDTPIMEDHHGEDRLYSVSTCGLFCVSINVTSGHRCSCSTGYEGNPYLIGGCQDINECLYPSMYLCNGTCINTNGSYSCSCPAGTESDDPKKMPCTPISNKQAPMKVVIGISISILFLMVCVFSLLAGYQKRRLAEEKKRFFKQNGGPILYQNILSRKIDTVIIFTIEDLKKATNNFDISRELGTGGHGTVYKGILGDNKEVAVKRSKIVSLIHIEEFVQEIIILSQINHKNIIRLLGCCLEVEVPILVYEFISNGTLFQLIHDNHDRSISFEDRLRIAQESAEALEYLHLSINHPIVHGDVKSLNILLDDNYKAKVTDFGASRMLPKDAVQFMTMVQGTLGYLDPEYLQEQKLTEKSDVYSFGVVLLELITRKTAIYFQGHDEGINLATSFLQALMDNRVQSMLDASIMYDGTEELFQEVAELASQCLSMKGSERPSMTQVADKLKAIRSTWSGILLLKHEETQRLAEQLGTDSVVGELSPSMYWTARHLGLDIETPHAEHVATTNML